MADVPHAPSTNITRTDQSAIVVGGGPVGLSTALALTRAGIPTTLVTAAQRTAGFTRTAALFEPSLALLENLGVRTALTPSPLTGIRIVDDMGGLLRAPEVTFRASEIGASVFGHNIANAELEAVLRQSLTEALTQADTTLTWIDNANVANLEATSTHTKLTLVDGRTVTGSVVIAADGRSSVCRKGSGITVREHAYAQFALTTTFTHGRPHEGISTEFHRPAGPCTTVPLPGRRSSLVWVETPATAERLTTLDDAAFASALETRLQGVLGPVSALTPRAMFPLSWMQADTMAANRVLLAGEAAHVMPPIGAQGLNLGLRDVGYLVDGLTSAWARDADLGGEPVMAAYSAARRFDIASRMTAIDALNRSLLAGLLPVTLARGAGLLAARLVGPLRRQLIAVGMRGPGPLPSLMRPAQQAA